MVEVFVPNGYCSKTFWKAFTEEEKYIPNTVTPGQQPFSVYHLSQPHLRRLKHDHLGASPLCRASASKSMKLLRKVLQPAINQEIVEVLEKYILVFREAAENASENMTTEQFTSSSSSVDVDRLVSDACQDALNSAKSLFSTKESSKAGRKRHSFENISANKNPAPANIPTYLLHNGKRRVASPDFPWHKRLKDEEDRGSVVQRRSLSPVPKKRMKPSHPLVAPRRYGSPHRNTKDSLRRKIENWDPSRLILDTQFVMGTKANRALGLGATRGRIYMKHPDLFKYAGDHDDKKWMVKNNCMAATGGKNTFLMLADDVMHLYETEYKDSPGTMPEELQFFKLPEFVLEKMRAAMVDEKKLRLRQLAAGTPPVRDVVMRVVSSSSPSTKQISAGQRSMRQAAHAAAAAINAASDSPDDQPDVYTTISTSGLPHHTQRGTNRLDTDSDPAGVSDEDGI